MARPDPGTISSVAPKYAVDRRRDIAFVLLLLTIGGAWFSYKDGARLPEPGAWLNLLWTVLSLVLCVGIYRASEWARRLTAIVAILQAGRTIWGIGAALFAGTTHGRSSLWALFIFVALVFVVFWVAIAIYLLRSSTRALFAHVRAARAGTHPAPN